MSDRDLSAPGSTGPGSASHPASAIVLERVSVSVEEIGPDNRSTVRHPILTEVSGVLSEPVVSIIGANGSGKSTLLHLCNGLVAPTSGRVTVDGLDTVGDGSAVRRRVGFVFTDPAAQLVMPTPLEDVQLSLRRSVRNRRERRTRALEVLAELGVEDLAERSVYELSGGQRQLVALAAVLAVDPAVLVLDEPTTLLDLANRELLRATLRRLVEERGVRIIISTHDLDVAADADRTLLIEDGRLAADGTPAEVIAEYTARVLGAAGGQ
ncbi:ABC transporter ATP-binding protein [Brevibacterium daeguense]|uniref:ABC transporter ATP-binding protein n=1 Tax=Brevibacterium daeguense TaxID=909936 RepID=A0ABP8EGB2_9MICO|nr:energy-coupling factor ABC transporter ATP-binding protein [Brevibacterium daeguense]